MAPVEIIDKLRVMDIHWILPVIFIAFALYGFVFSFLQARELKVLQSKLKTSIDSFLTFSSFVYLFIQFILVIIVVILLIL